MRAILTWHSIDASGSPISVAPLVFRRQLDWLRSGRVRVVSVDELLALPDSADAVALTFDDGFENFAREAAPMLLHHALPATVFVVTDRVGRDNRWPERNGAVPVLPLMDWDALGRLQQQGVVIGAHTRTHQRLTGAGTDLVAELRGAAEEIERELGARPAGFAYPYGAFNRRVARAAASEYRWACTTEFQPVRSASDPLALPRLVAWYFRDPCLLETWGTARFRAWMWTRSQGRAARTAMARLAGPA